VPWSALAHKSAADGDPAGINSPELARGGAAAWLGPSGGLSAHVSSTSRLGPASLIAPDAKIPKITFFCFGQRLFERAGNLLLVTRHAVRDATDTDHTMTSPEGPGAHDLRERQPNAERAGPGTPRGLRERQPNAGPAPAAAPTAACSPGARKLSLWEREALETEQLGGQQRARTAAMVAQRVVELTQAKARETACRAADDRRSADEARRRDDCEQERADQLIRVAEQHAKTCADAEEGMRVEQQALNAERLRQVAAQALRDAGAPQVDRADDLPYNWEEGMGRQIKTFRQRGSRGDTLLIKIDHGNNRLQVVYKYTTVCRCRCISIYLSVYI